MNLRGLRENRLDLIFIIFLTIITLWYWAGVADVPFHPDESTLLFMSADFEASFLDPASLAWQPDTLDPRQQLRLLDAPLGRYLTGFSRSLSGYEPLQVDWNWGKTWNENQASGAVPEPNLLLASRFGPSALFPISVLLLYLTGKRLKGNVMGWAGAVFLASNALILLHTRRAMAEGGLTFTVSLFIASLVFCRNVPWLIALSAALAFCAKQSTLPLAAVGFLAVLFYSCRPFLWKRLAINLVLYTALWVSVLWLLNPFLWKYPVQSIQAAITARQTLLSEQTQSFNQALPDASLNSPGLVSLSLIANQFILSPSIAEVGNYLAQTKTSAQAYLENPFHQLFRGLVAGGILLALSAFGLFYSVKLGFSRLEPDRIFWLLMNIAGILQFAALSATVTLPFQRYVVPLIPFTCLWMGFCIQQLTKKPLFGH